MSGDHVERLRAWRAFSSQNRPGYDHMRDVSYDKAPVCDADLDAALAELERLRAEVADFPELLANAQEVGLERIEAAFGEGWDKCRKHLDDEAQIKRQIYVTEYSNTLPWPKWAAPQQPERDGAGS